MIICAIDTDTKGSIAKLNTETNELCVFALPNHFVTVNKTKRLRLHVPKACGLLNYVMQDADHTFLEQQNARPGQGSVSVFSFGQVYGTLIGLTNASMYGKCENVHFVTGAKWKSSMGVSRDKKLTVNTASMLAPDACYAWKMAKHTSAAEAFLIALYGAGALGVSISRKPIKPVKESYKELTSLT